MTKSPKKIDLAANAGSTRSHIGFAFFGTSHIAVYVLEALLQADLVPTLVVTLPPTAQGRGMEAQSTAVEEWAKAHEIGVAYDWKEFETSTWDVAIVVDYGKLLPKKLLDIPRCGFLNIHPSLLPRLRGPSPMRSAILHDEREVGVTIMRVDEELDHGPIVAQKKVPVPKWPVKNSELEALLVPAGGALLAQILPYYVAGEIEAREQNHDLATFSEKFEKEDGLLDLHDDAYKNLLKIRALEGWPGTFAFFERSGKKIRVQIIEAHLEGKSLALDLVKPEGKREMPYADFLRSGAVPLQ
jgi:methionyl-tRNA formyltransferase